MCSSVLYCSQRKRRGAGRTEKSDVQTEYTRLGRFVVVERFTREEKRILDGRELSEDERSLHKEMVKKRFLLFLELKERMKNWIE